MCGDGKNFPRKIGCKVTAILWVFRFLWKIIKGRGRLFNFN